MLKAFFERRKLALYTALLMGLFFVVIFWMTPSGQGTRQDNNNIPEVGKQPVQLQHQSE